MQEHTLQHNFALKVTISASVLKLVLLCIVNYVSSRW